MGMQHNNTNKRSRSPAPGKGARRDTASPVSVFQDYCRRHGLRCTRARDRIVEEIYRLDGHFDIDDIFLRIRNRRPRTKLAKASIYRTLPHLIGAGLIRASLAEGGRACYEHTLGHGHHDHMKCVKCGRVFEFYERKIDQIQQEVCRKRRFTMLWHTHVVNGYCAQCKKAAK